MSETVPDSADRAIREYLGAVAFTLVLLGGEMMVEKEGSRFVWGLVLMAAALPIYLSGAWWKLLKSRLNKSAVDAVEGVAVSTPWWVRSALIATLAFLIFNAFLQIGRLDLFSAKMETLSNCRFTREVVVLDNRRFYQCTFDNVKFKYGGAPVFISPDSKYIGFSDIEITDTKASNILQVLTGMGVLMKQPQASIKITPHQD